MKVLLACLMMACGVADAATLAPPMVGSAQPVPVAKPYDTTANAQAEVTRAFATAKASGRLVLLDFGGNWCPDCRVLAGMFALPSVAPWLDAHFVTVEIDVGRFDKNMDLARRYGVTVTAVPALLVLTPDGKLLNPDGARALGDARTMSAKDVMDLLAGWASR